MTLWADELARVVRLLVSVEPLDHNDCGLTPRCWYCEGLYNVEHDEVFHKGDCPWLVLFQHEEYFTEKLKACLT